ncbi:expressed unknown protein [Seminavis robusta]|uniref:Uncharacterized protein n=1 Tax=Seminavis robusta TaxID=568900 RepID=A0A9N8I1P6_9STRA|nr:expressed unknown protein [Seminavis robusta]|eukprot:Sro4061_g352711.1  (247) ;mRNA; f:1379-2119
MWSLRASQVIDWFVTAAILFLISVCNAIVLCAKFFFSASAYLLIAVAEDHLDEVAVAYCRRKNLIKEKKTVTIASPPPKLLKTIAVKTIPAWASATDIDGVRSECLANASFRFKHSFRPDTDHVQGSVFLQQFESTKLHRIYIKGFSHVKNTHLAMKGDPFDGPVCLPIDCGYTTYDDIGKSQKRGVKHFLLRLEFDGNDEGLEYLQIIVEVGNSSSKLSSCLAFQQQLILALEGSAVDEEEKMSE